MSKSSRLLFPIIECRACSSKRLLKILTLGKHYLSDFTKGTRRPRKFPLELVLCRSCNLLQLRHTAPSSFLYTERYGYKSGINNTMKNELKEIVEQALKTVGKHEKHLCAVDIGANDGTLLNNYPKNIYKIGIEPIKKFAKECTKNADIVINDFFNLKSFIQKAGELKADIVTVISCFYDMEKPNEFLSGVKHILNKNGILVIQQNYLLAMLQNNAFDNIVHEHLEYYSLLSLENLLKKHNLEVFDVYMSTINGGSFRTQISHKGERKIRKSVIKLREQEKESKLYGAKVYKEFSKRVRENRKEIRLLINSLIKDGKKVYIYGASTRGNTLIQYFRLGKDLIQAAVERNPEKWAKKIASVGIPIISEEQARFDRPDYMLVLPWFFKDEFLIREREYLESGGHFIFPLPVLKIV